MSAVTTLEARSVDDFAHLAIAVSAVAVSAAGVVAWLAGADGLVALAAVALAWSPIALAISFGLHVARDRFVPVEAS